MINRIVGACARSGRIARYRGVLIVGSSTTRFHGAKLRPQLGHAAATMGDDAGVIGDTERYPRITTEDGVLGGAGAHYEEPPASAGAEGPESKWHVRGAKRPVLGFVAGAGPDAGLDLMAKVMKAFRRPREGFPLYQGDHDAPRMWLCSEPWVAPVPSRLTTRRDWTIKQLQRVVQSLGDNDVSYYAIACNTLHVCAWPVAAALGDKGPKLVSLMGAAARELRRRGVRRVGIIGTKDTMRVADAEMSPYASLSDEFEIVTPDDPDDEVTQVIFNVKQHGLGHPGLKEMWARVVASVDADVVLLACTELPLLPEIDTPKTLLDVTGLLAEELAQLALGIEIDLS